MADKKNLNDKKQEVINEAELDKVAGGNSSEPDGTLVWNENEEQWVKSSGNKEEKPADPPRICTQIPQKHPHYR